MLCSGSLERILYALSVTCRPVFIIERGKVRAECKVGVCVCVCKQELNAEIQSAVLPSLPPRHRGC